MPALMTSAPLCRPATTVSFEDGSIYPRVSQRRMPHGAAWQLPLGEKPPLAFCGWS
jgi:hypothetical protein